MRRSVRGRLSKSQFPMIVMAIEDIVEVVDDDDEGEKKSVLCIK